MTLHELWSAWHECNVRWFGGKLAPPSAIRITRARKYEGRLNVTIAEDGKILQNKINLSAHCDDMLATLIHEMIHQYQMFVMEVDPDHGWSFRGYAKWLERETGRKIR